MQLSRYRILFVFCFVIFSLSRIFSCIAYGADPSINTKESPAGRLITITDGIRIVQANSRLVKMALLDKEIAFDDSLAARSGLLPRLNAFATQTFLENQPIAKFDSLQAPTAEKQSFSYGFDVYQTVFDFRRNFLLHEASLALVNARSAGFEQAKRLAVLEFVVAYFDLLESEKMIEVAQKQAESITVYSQDVQKLYNQGAAIKNDLLAAQVKLSDARQQLIAARNQREAALSQLTVILALPLTEQIRVEDIRMGIPNVPALEDCWKQARVQRLEIRVINEQMAATDASRKAALTGNLPEVYVDGGYGYTQNKYQVNQDNVYLNLGAKVNLYDGWQTKAEALKERDRQRRLDEQKKKLLEDIDLEIKESYLGLRDAVEKVGVTRGALDQAEENVRVNRVSFSEGATTSSQVLDAIAMQTTAQTNYYRADYQLKREYSKFMYSTGIDLALVYEAMQKGSEKDGKQ